MKTGMYWRIALQFSPTNDDDIIEWLGKQGNRTDAIRQAIREKMKREQKEAE